MCGSLSQRKYAWHVCVHVQPATCATIKRKPFSLGAHTRPTAGMDRRTSEHTHSCHFDRLFLCVHDQNYRIICSMKANEYTKWRLFAISADIHTIFVATHIVFERCSCFEMENKHWRPASDDSKTEEGEEQKKHTEENPNKENLSLP